MSLEYKIRPFGDEIEAAYARLFPANAGDKGTDPLRWRFRDAAHGRGYFATAEDPDASGAIVGMIGLTATRLHTAKGAVGAFQAVDTVVDPAYRGRGLFTSLGRAVHEGSAAHGADLVWGFPNANAAPGWFGKLGWRNLGTAPFLIRPIRTGYFLRRFASGLRRINFRLLSARQLCGSSLPGISAAPSTATRPF
jgi:GNAT superfamily N-acetyltransferase